MKKVLMLVAVLAITGIASAELLTSPGFEEGLWANAYGEARPGGGYWYYGGRSIVTDTLGAKEGDKYLNAYNWRSGATSGYSIVWQEVAITAGTEYTFSAYFKDAWGGSGVAGAIGGGLKIEFFDGPGGQNAANKLGTVDGSADILKDWDLGWQQLIITSIAPVGATHVIAVVGTDTANSSIWVDGASLVPEPATMALLGLGGLFLRRRRK